VSSVPIYLLLPLGAAIIYALGSIAIKRALKEGVSMDQSFHLTNFVMGILFLPLFAIEKTPVNWAEIYKPLIMGIAFFAGTWLTFLGIKRGDVSLVTPIMGTKVVFVAIGVVLLTGKEISPALWIAAVLTPLGIFVTGLTDLKKGKHLFFTVLVTLASAAFFGLCDVLVNWWAGDFGAVSFLAVGTLLVALLSLVMWLFQGQPTLRMPKSGAGWAWSAALFIGLQAMLIGLSLSFFDDATGINVVYASRALWVIVLVVVFGTFLGNTEHRDNGKGFLWRVIGTVILTAAIIIAVMDRSRAEGLT
jgi:drug/metabolite transporter (DMT)-like permease